MAVKLAVIPVAGRGTRLIPLTKSLPKEMLPVGRKPVVQYVVEELDRCGLQKLLFITGPTKIAIENHFDLDMELINHLRETGKEELLNELAFEKADLQYFYTRQRRQLGLGHAILCAESFVGNEPFVVALGDTILGVNAKGRIVERMIEVFEERDADAVIAFEEVPEDEVHRYGIAKPVNMDDPDIFQLAGIVEKPSAADAPSRMAVASRYVFKPKIFDFLYKTKPGKNDEIQLTDAIQAMIAAGGKVFGVRVTAQEHRFDIGNYESYFLAFLEFALADPDHGDAIREKIKQMVK
ncbi:MAG: UTP--glucose-1-phosphate uridylyltransferase [Thermoguttaceae bacterium]|nr:UTP--glucose-1-phosphate uridylyltransferase [Thermoguttaceae bacterium]